MSAATSRSSPSSHASPTRAASSTMMPAYPATRLRWNAGWSMRRWRRWKSPSLVSSPSPSTIRAASNPGPFLNDFWWVTSTARIRSARSTT